MIQQAVIVCGPTASGKSRFALSFALKHRGAIINIDSCQVYRDLDIITASPNSEDKKLLPHYLYNYLAPDHHHSVEQHLTAVDTAANAALSLGYLPVIVGGSGMYIESLLYGLHSMPAITEAVRQHVNDLFARLGKEQFYQLLSSVDPLAAARVRASDAQRMQRAFEVLEQTGSSIVQFLQGQRRKVLSNYKFKIYLILPERSRLYERCNQRVHELVAAGAIKEVETLWSLWPQMTSSVQKILGVTEIRSYLQKACSYESAIDTIQLHTRRYAKRQYTWFRHHLPSRDVEVINAIY